MLTVDCSRPPKLFRYSEYKWNKISLLNGEFRLRPASEYRKFEGDRARQDDELIRETISPRDKVIITNQANQIIKPLGDVTYWNELKTDYYAICFSTAWDILLFDEFTDSDSCLIIHNPEEFCERVHFHVDKLLPGWIGIDAAVAYLEKSPLGVTHTKHWKFLAQKEWRFSWCPPKPITKLEEMFIHIGNIEDIAEIVYRPSDSIQT